MLTTHELITSIEEDRSVFWFVCLFVSGNTQKVLNQFATNVVEGRALASEELIKFWVEPGKRDGSGNFLFNQYPKYCKMGNFSASCKRLMYES